MRSGEDDKIRATPSLTPDHGTLRLNQQRPFPRMSSTAETLERIDEVLKNNRRIEWTYIILTVILFGCGISCIIAALVTGKFAWSTPSAITTGLLYYPLREIKDIRQKNIALATAPMLISQLPASQAAQQIQKLLEQLYGSR
jgi:hypothetical protein